MHSTSSPFSVQVRRRIVLIGAFIEFPASKWRATAVAFDQFPLILPQFFGSASRSFLRSSSSTFATVHVNANRINFALAELSRISHWSSIATRAAATILSAISLFIALPSYDLSCHCPVPPRAPPTSSPIMPERPSGVDVGALWPHSWHRNCGPSCFTKVCGGSRPRGVTAATSARWPQFRQTTSTKVPTR